MPQHGLQTRKLLSPRRWCLTPLSCSPDQARLVQQLMSLIGFGSQAQSTDRFACNSNSKTAEHS